MYSVHVFVRKNGETVGSDTREIDETRYVKTLTGAAAEKALAQAINVLQGASQDALNKAFYDAYQEAGIDPFPGGGSDTNPDLK